jgi:hypothetical protein
MKNPAPGVWVTHYGRPGVIEVVGVAGYAVVRFPSSDGFPFPAQEVVRVSELKQHKAKQQADDDHEPAPF